MSLQHDDAVLRQALARWSRQGIPAQYAVVPGRTAAQYQAQVEDAHGSVSYPPETQGIDPPNGERRPVRVRAVVGHDRDSTWP